MSYSVALVDGRCTRHDFERLPALVYRDDPRWVPPLLTEDRRALDERRNPYFETASLRRFVCYRRRQPVARASLVVDGRYRARCGRAIAHFGYFECQRDAEAVGRLTETMMAECRVQRADVLEGPFNPNYYSPLGLQASRFDVGPAFFETYNPPYYLELLRQAGFTISKRLHTRRNDRVAEYLRRGPCTLIPHDTREFTLRHVDVRDTGAELERLRSVFNDAFDDNWRFLPVGQREYAFAARGLFHVTRPDLITLVEYGREPVGAWLCVLDVNPLLRRLRGHIGPLGALRFMWERRRVRALVVYAVGIKRAFQGTRVFPLLLHAMRTTAARFDTLATTWMSDDNLPAIRAAEQLGLEPYKEFVIVEKRITEVHHA